MSTVMRPASAGLALLLAAVALHLSLQTPLNASSQLALWWGQAGADFAHIQYQFTAMPRVLLALMIGAAMGLVGSLMQQLLQNPLVSPMTLGAASGAWLGVLVMGIFWPLVAQAYGEWGALGGAILAVGLVLVIAGRRGLSGLPVILAGMAVNLLLGALASAVVLLNSEYAQNFFIWGAGDLTQSDWRWVDWLWPRLLPVFLLLVLAPRPLRLLRLGEQGAQARGLSLLPVLLGLLLVGLWLTAVSITAVGLIGFIGLMAPNIARLAGACTPGAELYLSALVGALALLLTDSIALSASQHWGDLVPTGAATALIGAPALIWLVRSQRSGTELQTQGSDFGRVRLNLAVMALVGVALLASLLLALFWIPSTQGWRLSLPGELLYSLRWPRVLAAAAAGCALAIAGVVLQRLIRNPLASPDILGLSAGATLALIVGSAITGLSVQSLGAPVAFLGSALVLGVLLLVGRRHQYAPGTMALTGIALAALLDALVQFTLAKGDQGATALVSWLSGSTYQVSAGPALMLAGVAMVALLTALSSSRGLTLLAIGDAVARGRGIALSKARLLILLGVALVCAAVTALVGPIAFVGLLAPHMATALGARKVRPQLLVAALVGTLVLVLADWVGRVFIYPAQLPAGLVAAVVGGSYFVALLVRQRLHRGF